MLPFSIREMTILVPLNHISVIFRVKIVTDNFRTIFGTSGHCADSKLHETWTMCVRICNCSSCSYKCLLHVHIVHASLLSTYLLSLLDFLWAKFFSVGQGSYDTHTLCTCKFKQPIRRTYTHLSNKRGDPLIDFYFFPTLHAHLHPPRLLISYSLLQFKY